MKERIAQCTVQYTSWEMECCGNPIRVGQIVNLPCIKGEPYTCSCGVEIDYCEEHHGMGANCMIRGKVTRIRTVFAESSDGCNIIDVDDPENIYNIFDVSYIDGWEKPDCYGGRENKSYYIITVENTIECLLDGHAEYDEELHVCMEADAYSDEVFSHMGTVDRLKLYSGRKTKKIDLTQFAWHKDLVEWNNEYKDNRLDNDTDELKWWSKGWAVAKEIRKIMPEDIEFVYDATIFEIMDGKTLFTTTIPNNMQNKIDAGLFIPDSHVDSRDDENCSYMFRLNGAEHDLYPNDRVMIGICDTGNYQTGRVSKCTSDTLLIKTDWPLEKSDSYSVEAILFPL